MSLSAADLQKRHALEGTPDPFPSLSDNATSARNGKPKAKGNAQQNVDVRSDSAFPALASAAPKKQAGASAWSGATVSRISRPAVQVASFTDSFDLDRLELKPLSYRDTKPATLGEVMRLVMKESGATVEASTQRHTGRTTFVVKGTSENSLEEAKRLLVSHLSPTVTKKVDAPVSTIGYIIGPKGATLKRIRDQTNTKIDIPPRRDALGVPANGESAQVSRSVTPQAAGDVSDEEDEPTTAITVSGPGLFVEEAISEIQEIINFKTSKTTQRVRDIPAHILPFLNKEKDDLLAKFNQEHPNAHINITANSKTGTLVCQGDRVVVAPLVEALKAKKSELEDELKPVTISIPRNQHRFVLDEATADEFFEKYGVIIQAPEAGEGITLYGTDLGNALNAVLSRANSHHVQTVDLPGPPAKSQHIWHYIEQTSYFDIFKGKHPQVTIHVPSSSEIAKLQQIPIDLEGERAPIKAAVQDLKAFVKKLEEGVKEVPVDWMIHRAIQGKQANKIKQFHDAHNIFVVFPPESAEISTILLVHDPLSAKANVAHGERNKRLDGVAKEISTLATEVGNVKSETLIVDKKWHSAIHEQLESIIGSENVLVIKLGSSGKDDILVRGPADEVERAVSEIKKVADEAEIDEKESGHVIEFEIPREYVGRIVGAQGAGIRSIRDALNVRIDIEDANADDQDKEWTEKAKGKKAVLKTKVKITGRKEQGQEAKKRILGQVDQWADEAQETLTIPRQYHSGLIGPSGKYVTRMEETHSVKIFFYRENHGFGEGAHRGRDLKPDEVQIKGGKKGVAAAKTELLELVEFEKANNNVLRFTVPTRAVSRILGRGGNSIQEIKENTGANIDVEKEESAPGVSTIVVKGSVQETKDAKAAIMSIADEVGEETEETIIIEPKFHRNFIGKGGETLRQLVADAGGPTDARSQAGLVHFPRPGEPADEVRLRGDQKVVAKLKKELERLAAQYRDRVVLGLVVPAAQHRLLIGRGGQHLNDVQSKTGTQIWFPGSRAYASAGELDNGSELGDAIAEEIVKICGPRAACEAAISELQAKMEQQAAYAASRAPREPRTPTEAVTRVVQVPLKHHHTIVRQHGFQRTLRPLNVFVDFSEVPNEFVPARPASKSAAASARIDQDEESTTAEDEWQVIPNWEGADEGTADWTFRGHDEESLDKAEANLKDAIDQAESLSHVGFLTLVDRSAFPRIVGAKGSNVSRIRGETSTDITVGKGDNTIVIIGSKENIQAAKDAIMQIVNSPSRGGRRDRDDY